MKSRNPNPYEAWEVRFFSHASDFGAWERQPPLLVRTNARSKREAIARARGQIAPQGWIYAGSVLLPDRQLIGTGAIDPGKPRDWHLDPSLPERGEGVERFKRFSAE